MSNKRNTQQATALLSKLFGNQPLYEIGDIGDAGDAELSPEQLACKYFAATARYLAKEAANNLANMNFRTWELEDIGDEFYNVGQMLESAAPLMEHAYAQDWDSLINDDHAKDLTHHAKNLIKPRGY